MLTLSKLVVYVLPHCSKDHSKVFNGLISQTINKRLDYKSWNYGTNPFPPFLDIDECMNKTHSCDVNVVCNNTEGSYNCTCKPGYSGDGKKCIGN